MVDDPAWTYRPARTAPAPNDIVWCRFPTDINIPTPAPKPRPALVRQVSRQGDKVAVTVVYGTSKANRDYYGSFLVHNLNDMIDAGLPQATRFELVQSITLPWSEEYFIQRGDGTGPVVGSLNYQSLGLLKAMVKMMGRQR